MKKVLFILLVLICIVLTYLYIKEISFSPLKEKEFEILFQNYNGNGEKICSIDFLGLNFKGELFEFYLYKTGSVSIDSIYPKFENEWEHNELTIYSVVSKWKNCPIDSATMELYKFTLLANNLNEKECSGLFDNELNNPKNYYSYVYFNELENYFLLYCPDKENLYYIRRKGF